MNTRKIDLCREVSHRLHIPLYTCQATLEALLAAWTHRLQAGDPIYLRGWGALFPVTRKGRGGVRNPRTMEPAPPLPRRRVVRYRPYLAVREGLAQ